MLVQSFMKLQKKTRGNLTRGKENVQPAQSKRIKLAAKAYIDHVMKTMVGEAGEESDSSDLSSIIITKDN